MDTKRETSQGRGRPREFDVDQAIRAAMEVFQTHGYEATSLPDLLAGTGLSRGSLYKAFTDKRTLFLAALDCYIAENSEGLRVLLSSVPARQAIRSALTAIAKEFSACTGERGCLVVGTATEMAAKDAEVKERIKGTFAVMQRYFKDAIKRGQVTGEIAANRDAETLSRLLLCIVEGLGVLGKTGRREIEMVEIVDAAMEAV